MLYVVKTIFKRHTTVFLGSQFLSCKQNYIKYLSNERVILQYFLYELIVNVLKILWFVFEILQNRYVWQLFCMEQLFCDAGAWEWTVLLFFFLWWQRLDNLFWLYIFLWQYKSDNEVAVFVHQMAVKQRRVCSC